MTTAAGQFWSVVAVWVCVPLGVAVLAVLAYFSEDRVRHAVDRLWAKMRRS